MSQASKNQRKKTHIATLYQRLNELAGAIMELQVFMSTLDKKIKKLEKDKKSPEKLIMLPEEL